MQAKEASPHPPPASGATTQWEVKRKESAPTHNSAPPVAYRCRVHKPGVPRGPASTPRLPLSGQHTTHGSAQGSKTTGRKSGPVTSPTARRLLQPTSPTGALASDSSRLRTASPIGRLAQSATSDSDPASPTGVHKDPAHRSSPTGATRAD